VVVFFSLEIGEALEHVQMSKALVLQISQGCPNEEMRMRWTTEMLDMSSRVRGQNSKCVDGLPQDVLWVMVVQWLLDANSEKMVK
jgi:hypothetical protein